MRCPIIVLSTEHNTTKHQTMNASKEIAARFELATDPKFIAHCAKIAEAIGMSAEEWDKNKATVLLLWANEAMSAVGK